MKAKYLELQNFQVHREKKKITLAEKITAITGASDKGKTAIARCLNWIIKSRPQGFGFRHDPRIVKTGTRPLDPREITSGTLVFKDGTEVIRERNGKNINRYVLNGKVLEALRADVPDEISSVINISDYCIQDQHSSYFLIGPNDTPGDVAKRINELTNLEIIDSALKKIGSIITNTKKDVEESSSRCKSLQKEIDDLDYIDVVKIHLDEIENFNKEYLEEKNQLEQISDLIVEIETLKSELAECDLVLKIEKQYLKLEKLLSEYKEIEKEYNEIGTLISSIDEWTEDLKDIYDILDLEQNIIELFTLMKDVKEFKYELHEFIQTIEEAIMCTENIEELTSEIEKGTNQLKEILGDQFECPTCGSIVPSSRIVDAL